MSFTTKCGFSIKRPDGIRKSFAIHRKIYRKDATPLQPQVKDERLEAINTNFKSGILSEIDAHLQVKALVDKIKLEDSKSDTAIKKVEITSQNLKIYRKFHKFHYQGRPIVRPHTVVNEFNYALRAIEPLSIVSATKTDLQEKVNESFNEKQHKRYVGRINQLLKFCGRNFTLYTKKRIPGTVRYLSIDDLSTLLNFLQDPDLRNLYITLFGTGVRLGEAFVLKPRDFKPNGSIYIQNQMTEKRVIREIKNSKPHHTFVIKECIPGVKAWLALPHSKKEEIRTRCQHPLTNAAKKAFPGDRDRYISAHDLRHSFAIHLLGYGVPLDKVAKLLGDSLKTTEEYYAAFTMSDGEINFVRNLLA